MYYEYKLFRRGKRRGGERGRGEGVQRGNSEKGLFLQKQIPLQIFRVNQEKKAFFKQGCMGFLVCISSFVYFP